MYRPDLDPETCYDRTTTAYHMQQMSDILAEIVYRDIDAWSKQKLKEIDEEEEALRQCDDLSPEIAQWFISDDDTEELILEEFCQEDGLSAVESPPVETPAASVESPPVETPAVETPASVEATAVESPSAETPRRLLLWALLLVFVVVATISVGKRT
jgi:hypothetical protein